MWGQFKDPNGDINDPNNYIQGTAGSEPSWNGWRHPDIWKAEGWRDDLPDNWIPPQPPKTTEELLYTLDAEYQPQFTELAQALGLATLSGNQTVIDSIKEDYTALKAEYDEKREVITSGN